MKIYFFLSLLAVPSLLLAEPTYLLKRVSVSSDSGIRAFDVGTEVEIVSRDTEKITVSFEDVQFEVSKSDLTTEREEIERINEEKRKAAALQQQEKAEKRAKLQKEYKRGEKNSQINQKLKRFDEVCALIPQLERQRDLLEDEIARKMSSRGTPETRARDRLLRDLQKQIGDLEYEKNELWHWVKHKYN